MSSLHRIILYRLLAAWVVISLLIGVAVSWVGLRRIDRQLVSMATAELRMFAAANLDRLGHPETALAALDQLSAELSRDRFIAGEFQDNMRRKLAATVNPRYSELLARNFQRVDQHRPNEIETIGKGNYTVNR